MAISVRVRVGNGAGNMGEDRMRSTDLINALAGTESRTMCRPQTENLVVTVHKQLVWAMGSRPRCRGFIQPWRESPSSLPTSCVVSIPRTRRTRSKSIATIHEGALA
jgi:hypothetical protein